jgi:hypothetical protein
MGEASDLHHTRFPGYCSIVPAGRTQNFFLLSGLATSLQRHLSGRRDQSRLEHVDPQLLVLLILA